MTMFFRPPRKKYSNRERQEIYDRCCGDKEQPDCNICSLPVMHGQDWDVSHDPKGKPHALGGTDVGVAHSRCNRLHGAQVIRPLMAKLDRARQHFTGAWLPKYPMRCGRRDPVKRTMDGRIVERKTLGEQLQDLRNKGIISPRKEPT